MSIKDRNARVENRRRIVTEDSKTMDATYGRNATQGVPEEWGDLPPVRGHGGTGVVFPMPGAGDDVADDAPPTCNATTKAGYPCQAHPLQGKGLCIGHSRQ